MKKEFWKYLVVLLIGAAIGGFFYKRYRIPPSIELPDIALTDCADGKAANLRMYAGQPLFVNFFATWCGPCMREMPELENLKAMLADKKLQVVCIADAPIEQLQSLQMQYNGLIVLHSEKKLQDLGIYTYPTNYIFNSTGKKVDDKVDVEDWLAPEKVAEIRKLIE
jgi:thiol-disulfide isomerase/thioredoxin